MKTNLQKTAFFKIVIKIVQSNVTFNAVILFMSYELKH